MKLNETKDATDKAIELIKGLDYELQQARYLIYRILLANPNLKIDTNEIFLSDDFVFNPLGERVSVIDLSKIGLESNYSRLMKLKNELI